MSTNTTTTLASLKAKSAILITSIDTSLKTASTSLTKASTKLTKTNPTITKCHKNATKLQTSLKNLKANIEDVRSEVREYIKSSTEGYRRREVAHEADAAELEELLDVQRDYKRAAIENLDCMSSTSGLWSN